MLVSSGGVCVKICCSGFCSRRPEGVKCIYLYFQKLPPCVEDPPSLDRFTFSPQSKLECWGVIHLRAQQELCAAKEACTPHLHHTHATRTQVYTHILDLCGILTPLNHVMHSVSRHLDPLQADLYNGSAALPTLWPWVYICVYVQMVICLDSAVLSSRTLSAEGSLLSHAQSRYRYSHCCDPICCTRSSCSETLSSIFSQKSYNKVSGLVVTHVFVLLHSF